MSIPTGNITLLFTDIEGSTKLSQEFPEKLHAALERHNQILKVTLESNNGFIYDMIGDSFYCAFEKSIDAVNAAVAIQKELGKENWDEAVIKVRIGIHSGQAEWSGDRYMGYITLARTARVMSAAYGEQILISNDTYKLFSHQDTNKQRENETDSLCLSDIAVKNVCFRDLGYRRLKDVIEPIRLFQIESDGLREEFPPLKTLDARPNNLPIQLTSFIGREKEMKYIKEELKRHRLLSLTGTGGAGKTRFALQTAADVQGIKNIENNLKYFKFDKAVIIFGMMNDKNYKDCILELKRLNHHVIFTKPEYSRSAKPEDLFNVIKGNKEKFDHRKNFKEAYELALSMTKKNDLILITGSFFLVSDFLRLLNTLK